MPGIEECDHNDLIDITVEVCEIEPIDGDTRAYRGEVEDTEATRAPLIVWADTPAANCDWEVGVRYKIRDALVKNWNHTYELNLTTKTDVFPVTETSPTTPQSDGASEDTQSSNPGAGTESESSPAAANTDTGARVTEADAHALLKECIGPDAEFRPQQWEAINRLVNHNERLLLVQRTGWGKSTVYFIATRLLRDQGCGPTLIISPLISLMRDQIQDAEDDLGLHAVTIHSDNTEEWDAAKAAVVNGTCDLLLISPERLANPTFQTEVLAEMENDIGMLVIDEAHCISEWGHDFRPDYRRIQRVVDRLPSDTPIAATTATANDRVVDDVTDQLPGLDPVRGRLVRDSLKLQAIELDDREQRLAWLVEQLPQIDGTGIIYCLTQYDVERVTEWLQQHGIEARPYHSDIDRRREYEEKLIQNDVKALVATNALGMGFNKPDIGYVIHFQRPPNITRYYQEIGRAGRELDEAYAIVLSGDEDDDIAEYFIEDSFPEPADFEAVLTALEDSDEPLYHRQIRRQINISWPRSEQCLNILQVEGAIERESDGYVRTGTEWSYDYDRVNRVLDQRWRELTQMQEFVQTDDCLMRYIADALDGQLDTDCGRCANCAGAFVATAVADEVLIDRAVEHYRANGQSIIEPRKQLPHPGGTYDVIDESQRLEVGRCLSVWDDPGWGRLVRDGKYDTGRFDDALVTAAAELIEEEWVPDPEPTWVTAVPSTSTEGLVTDFAARLAAHLGIAFIPVIEKVAETTPQKQLTNSFQQCWNVTDAFTTTGPVRDDPVLLVDDVVGSRWTLTEVGRTLRAAGSGPVHPFALAKRRGQ